MVENDISSKPVNSTRGPNTFKLFQKVAKEIRERERETSKQMLGRQEGKEISKFLVKEAMRAPYLFSTTHSRYLYIGRYEFCEGVA